jgi:Aflatoxin regulatory protein
MGTTSLINETGRNARRTTSSVLIGNKEVMLALSTILHCSCSSKTQLQLIMATICDKLVNWYHAMIQSQDISAVSVTTSSQLRERGEKEPVLCQPIAIRRYSLDGAAEAQVTGREVLAHLKELEFLMASLPRRIKNVNLGSSPRHDEDQRASDERDILAIIGDGLLTHLMGRSQDVREEAARLAGEKKS